MEKYEGKIIFNAFTFVHKTFVFFLLHIINISTILRVNAKVLRALRDFSGERIRFARECKSIATIFPLHTMSLWGLRIFFTLEETIVSEYILRIQQLSSSEYARLNLVSAGMNWSLCVCLCVLSHRGKGKQWRMMIQAKMCMREKKTSGGRVY